MTTDETPKKRYVGEFLMPDDMAYAIDLLCKSFERHGYDFYSMNGSMGRPKSIFVSRWGTDVDIFAEPRGDGWQRYVYEEADDGQE